MIFHIPHSRAEIPEEYRSLFYLTDEQINDELLLMTDHYTDELFWPAITDLDEVLVFPVSRLLVDPERFPDDDHEEMSKVGMGALYTKTHSGKPLKNGEIRRMELLDRYFLSHHEALNVQVRDSLFQTDTALIIDCHSFPRYPLPYELDQTLVRPQICIGVDEFHTPNEVADALRAAFTSESLSVDINAPFSGSIVPLEYYRTDSRVHSVMIEVRRDGYMNELSGTKSLNFPNMQRIIKRAIGGLRN